MPPSGHPQGTLHSHGGVDDVSTACLLQRQRPKHARVRALGLLRLVSWRRDREDDCNGAGGAGAAATAAAPSAENAVSAAHALRHRGSSDSRGSHGSQGSEVTHTGQRKRRKRSARPRAGSGLEALGLEVLCLEALGLAPPTPSRPPPRLSCGAHHSLRAEGEAPSILSV